MKYVGIKRIPVAKLTKFPGNARRGQIEQIRASLRRHGQYRALVVRQLDDGSMVVLVGNNTLDALELEGITHARCELVVCDDDEALRINLVDNRLSDLADYDDVSLIEQLTALAGDFDDVGYTEDDLHRLMAGNKPKEAEAPDDFPSVDDGIATDYRCPRCGYEWSGNPTPA